jgi:hypothetical protein
MDGGKPLIASRRGTVTLRDSMANMEKRGLMKLGSGRLPKDFWRMVKAKDPRGSVLQALLEERGKVD